MDWKRGWKKDRGTDRERDRERDRRTDRETNRRTGRRGEGPLWLVRLENHCPECLKWLEIWVLMRLTAGACFLKPPHLFGRDSQEGLRLYREFTLKAISAAEKGREGQRANKTEDRMRKGAEKREGAEEREGIERIRESFYVRAYPVGRALSRLPGLTSLERKKRLIVLLYRNIGIQLVFGRDEKEQELGGEDIFKEREGMEGKKELQEREGMKGEKELKERGKEKGVGSLLSIPHCSFCQAYTPKACLGMSGLDAGIICGILGGGRLFFTRRLTQGDPCCQAVYLGEEGEGGAFPGGDGYES